MKFPNLLNWGEYYRHRKLRGAELKIFFENQSSLDGCVNSRKFKFILWIHWSNWWFHNFFGTRSPIFYWWMVTRCIMFGHALKKLYDRVYFLTVQSGSREWTWRCRNEILAEFLMVLHSCRLQSRPVFSPDLVFSGLKKSICKYFSNSFRTFLS